MADAFFTRAPSTIVTIPLNGQLEFTIPFEFLARKFVVVTLLGTDRKVLTMNTDYRFIAVNKISLTRQPDGSYTRIELRRVTSATDRLVNFIDGSILRATDLNLAQVQTMHVAEEARDMTSDNIGVNDEGDLDARNRKIVNLADAENDRDAVNLGQLRQFDTSTGSNADRAERSAAAAKVSEDNAAGSEDRCVVAEAKSISSAGTAMTAADDANRSKVAAKASEDAAEASKVAAAGYEQGAKAQADRATAQADRAEQEADKLANLNDFAASISEVQPTYVKFNRDVVAEGLYSNTSGTKAPVVQALRSGKSSIIMTVDESGNKGFMNSLGSPFMLFWDPSGNYSVSQALENTDRGNREIQGDLNVQKAGSNAKAITTTASSPQTSQYTASTRYSWYAGGVTIGAVRGAGSQSSGLIRQLSDGNAVGADIWLEPDGAQSYIRFSTSTGITSHSFSKSGDMYLGIKSAWLSVLLDGKRAYRRTTRTALGYIPASAGSITFETSVHGLDGAVEGTWVGQPQRIQIQYPLSDCVFQIQHSTDCSIFQLSNNGRTLTLLDGWARPSDGYTFYLET